MQRSPSKDQSIDEKEQCSMVNIEGGNTSIYLPGYQAQLSDNGVDHSRCKLEEAAADLMEYLSSITVAVADGRDGHLEGNDESYHLKSPAQSDGAVKTNKVIMLPCQNEAETLNYRCSCAFQIIEKNDPVSSSSDAETGTNDQYKYEYAMRQMNTPVPLEGNYFPIATPRIQTCMKQVLKELNCNRENHNSNDSDHHFVFKASVLRQHLASVQFVSSWNSNDCIVTLNYNQPLPERKDFIEWMRQAETLRINADITTLVLRSKKRAILVGRKPPLIRDELMIFFDSDIALGSADSSRGSLNAKVMLTSKGQPMHDATELVHEKSKDNSENKSYNNSKPVYYFKPGDAFQHPNCNTMIRALEWILNTLFEIVSTYRNKRSSTTINMLEMYCGCGAHTIPIAKMKLFDVIVAMELDQRLVDACKENCRLNHCYGEIEEGKDNDFSKAVPVSPVYVFQGDAGEWAKRSLSLGATSNSSNGDDVNNTTCSRSKTNLLSSQKSHWYKQEYQVLLVDPPRMGLDEKVCNLARNGLFDHIIYISCGRRALKKDLLLLEDCFEIVSITMTDLFPRTDAVETLVHLRRRGI